MSRAKRKLRVLALMHRDLVPPDSLEGHSEKEMMVWKTEFDVVATLRDMGHEARPLGVQDDLAIIRDTIVDWKPHVVFNLLEEFHSIPTYDQHVVAFLELLQQPYTGCNPRGLMLAHDKALCKKILTYHRIPTPKFFVFPVGRPVRPAKRMVFPLLVKSVMDDASLGISQASIVYNEEKLKERIRFVHEQFRSHALVEEYIEGREFYVGVLGNHRLQTFPVWELLFTKMPDDIARIATRKVKWDLEYQKKHGITTEAAKDLPPAVLEQMAALSKRIYRVLGLTGYARMDFRMSDDGRIYVLEANPNPNLSYGEDFAESAETVGIDYDALLQRIMHLGLTYRAAWRG
jgi:D-alanine-D-alanine ligase